MYRTAQKEWYSFQVPTSSLSCGGDVHVVGDVAVYVSDISQPSLPTSFYSLLVSVSVFMALSSKFSRQLSAFSLCSSGLISALLVLSAIYLFMKVSLSTDIILFG